MRELLVRVEHWAFDDESMILGFMKATLLLIVCFVLPLILFIAAIDALHRNSSAQCTAYSEEHSYTYYVPVGKVLVPRQGLRRDCISRDPNFDGNVKDK